MMILCVALPCVCGLCAGLHAKLCPCSLGLNCICTVPMCSGSKLHMDAAATMSPPRGGSVLHWPRSSLALRPSGTEFHAFSCNLDRNSMHFHAAMFTSRDMMRANDPTSSGLGRGHTIAPMQVRLNRLKCVITICIILLQLELEKIISWNRWLVNLCDLALLPCPVCRSRWHR